MIEGEIRDVLKEWLKNKGFGTMHTSLDKIAPDLTAYKDDTYILIEIKRRGDNIRTGIGQCFLYSTYADYVYLLAEDKKNGKLIIDHKLPFGLLSIEKNRIEMMKESEKFNPNLKDRLRQHIQNRLKKIKLKKNKGMYILERKRRLILSVLNKKEWNSTHKVSKKANLNWYVVFNILSELFKDNFVKRLDTEGQTLWCLSIKGDRLREKMLLENIKNDIK